MSALNEQIWSVDEKFILETTDSYFRILAEMREGLKLPRVKGKELERDLAVAAATLQGNVTSLRNLIEITPENFGKRLKEALNETECLLKAISSLQNEITRDTADSRGNSGHNLDETSSNGHETNSRRERSRSKHWMI